MTRTIPRRVAVVGSEPFGQASGLLGVEMVGLNRDPRAGEARHLLVVCSIVSGLL